MRANKKLGLWPNEVSFTHWSQTGSRVIELTWVLGSKFALMGSNALLMLFLANRLELTIYGVLLVTISTQLLVSRILMMGVNVGMVRLSALEAGSAGSREVVAAGLNLIFASSAILVVLLIVTAPLLYFLEIPFWVAGCAVAGAIGTSLVDYGYSFRLAEHQYPLAAIAQGGTALLRFGLTSLTALVSGAYQFVFIFYHLTSLLSGLVQAAFIPRANKRGFDSEQIKKLLRYSWWQGQANVIVIFTLYQGTFLLMLLGQEEETGIFGLSLTLSLGFFAIYNAYNEYLLARVRTVATHRLTQFVKRAYLGSIALTILCIPVILVLMVLLPYLLHPELSETASVFLFLSASMALLILQSPLEIASHYLLLPKLVSFGWAMRAVFIGIVGLFLAPNLGATGAAIAQLVGSLLATLVFAVVVSGAVRSRGRTESLKERRHYQLEVSGGEW